ncbi:M1 family metallopeptidase [Oscillatoria sp. FACHB-1406]|uniref:M1 family metallopeptidase n=1 Tax=Oscillatoria sp. FACHB-1406 TaxID=2692846 RepID=UPI0016898754|nr:M1 family metallopeptidase [Oscillatoria sp. FACHB-1406]MBD2579393.1 M1 family metallopeptidase [Oscillatoria sp. FACHB-1406]
MTNYYFDDASNGRRSFELPGAKPHYNPDRPGQVEHIFLDLTLDLPQQILQGTCTISLKPVRANLRHLTLDAVDLNIKSVTVGSIAQPFEYDGEYLQIELLEPPGDKTFNLAIAYSLEQPQRGIYFIQPDEHYPNKPTQVWTQGEDEDSRFWFPCFDYPGQLATSEIRIRVPQPYLAISNGKLIATETGQKDTIYHWKQEQVHPSYLITLAVGNFAEIQDKWKKIPVTYYVEKGWEKEAKLSMGRTPEMMSFLSAKYGYPYPFPKYAQICVDDFIFGGMENTSTTILTDRCLLDERAAIDNDRTESLVVHELAHQWFGDLVVIKHWSHAWLKEGAASYSEVQWTEFAYGKDDGAYYLLNEARSYLSEDRSRYRRPMVTHIYREAIELYDRHLYEKGACVYHMIRAILGNELFDKTIKTFLHDNAHKTVETIDLLRAIEKSTGRNLAFLFDQYVFRGGHPDFKVSYAWDSENKLAKVTVKQTQAKENEGKVEDLFELTIPIGFGYVSEKGKKVKQPQIEEFSIRLDRIEQSFYFPLKEKPQFFSFDTGNAFLKTVSLDYGMPELKAQLKHDPDAIGRIYAAIALAKKGGLEVTKALAEALTHDPFWGVRVEVAKQLAKLKLDRALKALISGLKDEDARVRRAVVESLGKFKREESYKAVKKVAQKGDPSYYVEAAAIRILGSTIAGNLKDKQEEVLQFYQTVLQERAGWNEVIRCGAIAGLSQMKTSPVAADTIVEYTQLGVPQPLRLAAIRALGAVASGQTPEKVEEILEQLDALAAETFYLTQVSVSSALGQMQVPGAIDILHSLAEQTPDGRVRRIAEEAISRVQKNLSEDKNLKQLRDDLERLKQENQDLKSRLEKLEAQKK